MKHLTIINASIITEGKRIENGCLQIKDNRIIKISHNKEKGVDFSGEILDAQGLIIAPGLIDLQLNGGFGKDFTTEPEAIWEVAPKLLRYGVTSFLPTIISSPRENIDHAIDVIRRGPPKGYRGAHMLGLHLEGPVLNPEKKGAHNTIFFQKPSDTVVKDWHRENGIRIITLAPELEGALDLIHQLVEQGITVSAGHSNATYEQAKKGIEAGISMGTHLFNAMSPLCHRDPGLVGALLEDSRIKVGVIADGIHVHPKVVSIILKIKGAQNLILVSDAMSALGMPPGEYPQIDEIVYVDKHSARLADGSLAGSTLSMDAALRNMISYSGHSLEEVIPSLTSTPANCIGEKQTGVISEGNIADLVCLNQDLYPVATIISGEIVWKKNGLSLS